MRKKTFCYAGMILCLLLSVAIGLRRERNVQNRFVLHAGHMFADEIRPIKERHIPVQKIEKGANHINLRLGETVKIDAKAMPENVTNPKLLYRAANKKYLTVDEKGMLTAKRAGVMKLTKVIVTAAENGKKATISVRILPKIDPKKKMIALTFDDGPNLTSNHRIADIFYKHQSAATFFVLGSLMGNEPAKNEVKRTMLLGNEIGSHTQNHRKLTSLPLKSLRSEIKQTADMIKSITGAEPKLLRPPYGAYNETVLKESNAPVIMWSIDTLDWKSRNAGAICRRVMASAADGKIVLMHSIYEETLSAVDYLVPRLKKKGYQLVTVSELYRYKKKQLLKNHSYNGF